MKKLLAVPIIVRFFASTADRLDISQCLVTVFLPCRNGVFLGGDNGATSDGGTKWVTEYVKQEYGDALNLS